MDKLGTQDYSFLHPQILMHDRSRIAEQIIACLKQTKPDIKLKSCKFLDLGASNGAIAYHLAKVAKEVIAIDIDTIAISDGKKNFLRKNLSLRLYNGKTLPFSSANFDIVIFRRTYGSVVYLEKLIKEIFRILKPGGVCYFEGHNKFFLFEDDYKLPFLPLMPPALAKKYVQAFGHNAYYIGHYQSYWQLKKTFSQFQIKQLTPNIIKNPRQFNFKLLYKYAVITKLIPLLVLRAIEPLMPDFIWILTKPTGSKR